jgi:hypothetical protein
LTILADPGIFWAAEKKTEGKDNNDHKQRRHYNFIHLFII